MNARLHTTATHTVGQMIRISDATTLAVELQRVRALTLAVFEAYEAAGALDVPRGDEFNPPLWELGHIGWFQQWWVGRNRQRHLGIACEPFHARLPCPHLSAASHGDDWYNSSSVAHALRWDLPLLSRQAAKEYLQATLAQTLQCLSEAENKDGSHSDADLYFYRLVLLHEAMHLEAAVYMAQALETPIELPHQLSEQLLATMKFVAPNADNTRANTLFSFKNQVLEAGIPSLGFAFDNELANHKVALDAFEIDARPVTWAQYLAFVEATGYTLPRYMRRSAQSYESLYFGQWQALDMQKSAVHLSWHDSQAYCLWAERRLPSEFEWECAALAQSDMLWGDVWEWTASNFLPYTGFQAHPYRDYSEPWFGSRKVLKGACAATLPIMRHAKYRNYFTPERTDIYAGFRTCAK